MSGSLILSFCSSFSSSASSPPAPLLHPPAAFPSVLSWAWGSFSYSLSLKPSVLFWACLPLRLPYFYGLLYCSGLASLCVFPIFRACPPLFLWPAVLSWSLLRPNLSVWIFSLRFGFPEAWQFSICDFSDFVCDLLMETQ